MSREKIDDLLRFLVEAAADFPGAIRAYAVPDERGVFCVELVTGEEMYVGISALIT